MKYALLIYSVPESYEALSAGEREVVSRDYMALAMDSRCVESGQLQPISTATTLRREGGQRLVTDGPFADTKEVFGGYYIVEADDLDQAIELADGLPTARLGGAVEVRPIVEVPSVEHAS